MLASQARYLAFPATLKLAQHSSLLPSQNLGPKAKFCHDLFYSAFLFFTEVTFVTFEILHMFLRWSDYDLINFLRDICLVSAEINSIFKSYTVFCNRNKINDMIDFCAAENWMMPKTKGKAKEMTEQRQFSG